MKTNIYIQLRRLSFGFLSLILLSCSDSPVEEVGSSTDNLQVVVSSTVIRADGSAQTADIVGVKDELVIANAEAMDALSPEQAVSMSVLMNRMAPQVQTKTFVKTTVRKAMLSVPDTDKKEILTGWPIDLQGAITALIESMRDRLKKNQSICIIVELWFDPMSEKEFSDLCHGYPYSPSVLFGDR